MVWDIAFIASIWGVFGLAIFGLLIALGAIREKKRKAVESHKRKEDFRSLWEYLEFTEKTDMPIVISVPGGKACFVHKHAHYLSRVLGWPMTRNADFDVDVIEFSIDELDRAIEDVLALGHAVYVLPVNATEDEVQMFEPKLTHLISSVNDSWNRFVPRLSTHTDYLKASGQQLGYVRAAERMNAAMSRLSGFLGNRQQPLPIPGEFITSNKVREECDGR